MQSTIVKWVMQSKNPICKHQEEVHKKRLFSAPFFSWMRMTMDKKAFMLFSITFLQNTPIKQNPFSLSPNPSLLVSLSCLFYDKVLQEISKFSYVMEEKQNPLDSKSCIWVFFFVFIFPLFLYSWDPNKLCFCNQLNQHPTSALGMPIPP